MPLFVHFFLLTALLSTSYANSESIEISSCMGLQRELRNSDGGKTLLLTGNLKCVANEWLEPIRITRDVLLQGNGSATLNRLDLTQLHPGIVIEEGWMFTLDKLVLNNLPPMHDSFELSFLEAMPGARISVMRSYVLHPECLRDIDGMLSRSREHHLCGTWFVCGTDRSAYSMQEQMEVACSKVIQEQNQEEVIDDDGSISHQTVVIAVVCLIVALGIAIVFIVIRGRWHQHTMESESLDEKEALTITSAASHTSMTFSTRIVKIDNDYSVNLDHQLGVGGFGTVYAGSYQNASAAVKVIKSWDVPKGHKLESEARLSIALEHPNVVKCLGTRSIKVRELFGEQHPQGEELCSLIFMEYCDRDELSRAIDRGEYVINFKTLKPKICAVLHSALDIAKGLQYLHSIGIIHGDIKPDNILRTTDKLDPRGYTCKVSPPVTSHSKISISPQICDFGLSKTGSKKMTASDTLGMISYMPPEMLHLGEMGSFTDIYSFGMVLWEMITSDVPYSEVDYAQILSEAVQGRRPEIPESTPYRISTMIEQCWNADYLQRPTAEELVEDLMGALSEWYASFPEGSNLSHLPNQTSSRLRAPWHSDYIQSEMAPISTEYLHNTMFEVNTDHLQGRSPWGMSEQSLISMNSLGVSDDRSPEAPCMSSKRRASHGSRPSQLVMDTALTSVHIDSLSSS